MVAPFARGGSLERVENGNSCPTDAGRNDMLFTLTNAHKRAHATVRVFFINQADAAVEEYSVCLPALQSIQWRASEFNPVITGIAFAIATDAAGRPLKFNWLRGSSARIAEGATQPWQPAAAIAKRTSGAVPPASDDAACPEQRVSRERCEQRPQKCLAASLPLSR